MHKSDKLGFGIMIGGLVLIGGSYLLFRLFGDSYLIAFATIAGWFILMGFIAKFFSSWNKNGSSE